MSWMDLSLTLAPETVHWPGHPRYTVTDLMSIASGDEMNVSAVSMCSHFGTHIDAPRHYFAEGAAVDELPADLLIGPCRVVSYEGRDHIPPEYVDGLDLGGVRRLLIRTSNSRTLAAPHFDERYIALTPAAAQRLVDRGIELLGVDGYSIGPFDPSLGMPVHRIFLGGGPMQTAIEELDLSGVEPGDYDLVAAPLRTAGLEGAPARVFVRPGLRDEKEAVMQKATVPVVVRSESAPVPAGPYSPALAWAELVFVSGQGPVNPTTGRVEADAFEAQASQALANVDALLKAAGSGRDKVLKVQVYLTDLADFSAMNELYADFFGGCTPPARTTIQAAGLPGGIRIELDAIAFRAP